MPRGSFRHEVINALAPLLPHGDATADVVARRLAVSRRTLARRLAHEGVTFSDLVDQLRSDLAARYLAEDDALPISQIAWLLGFREPSALLARVQALDRDDAARRAPARGRVIPPRVAWREAPRRRV